MQRISGVFVLVVLMMVSVAPAFAHARPRPGHKIMQPTRPAQWSPTTLEAAATPENRAALHDGHMATVTGEVIDVSCYVQLGKRGAAHVGCGTKCITNGAPMGLLDEQGVVYTLFAEQHHPRRDGKADIRAAYLPSLSKTITVDGILSQRGGVKALYVSVPVDTTTSIKY